MQLFPYTKLFKKFDPKQYKSLWALQKKVPVIPIVGHITFRSESFLKLHCELGAVQKLDPIDMRHYRLEYLKTLDAKYEEKMNYYYLKISEWTATMNSPMFTDLQGNRDKSADQITEMTNTLISAISLTSQIKSLTDELLLLHYTEHEDMKPSLLKPLMKALSMIKGVDYELQAKAVPLSVTIPLMKRQIQNRIALIWSDSLQNIERLAKSDWRDFLSNVFNISVESVKIGVTPMRMQFLALVEPIVSAKEILKPECIEPLQRNLQKFKILQNLQKHLFEATHLTYFYKIRSFSSLFFQIVSSNKDCIYMLKYIFRTFEDSTRLLSRVVYLEDKDALMAYYKKEVMTTFDETIVSPIVKSIEDSLRLKIHMMYIAGIKGDNPVKDGILDIKQFLTCDPLFLFGERVSIKQTIEERLSKTFYNLTAFNPKDWQTYEDMKCLAYHLYGLELQDSLLPPQKVEQGLDIIYFVKHMQEFVTNYHYSLHTQVFFEITEDNKKSINVFGATQAANSFHTHGIGIYNTVLTAVFKIVSKKVNLINQLLYEDYISNLCYAEEKYWKENKETLGVKYPTERAEEVARKIIEIGDLGNGQTFLDKFRIVISHIGNALG